MKTIRYNGEEWYEDRRSLLKRVRQWFFRPLGWEKPDRTDGAYDTRWDFSDRRDPFPICLFNHRVSIFTSWISVRVFGNYVHWGFRRDPNVMYGPFGTGYAYISRNGTPSSAHHWLWGVEKYHGGKEILKATNPRRAPA